MASCSMRADNRPHLTKQPAAAGPPVLVAACLAIFWPGAFIFGFPGVMARHWQQAFQVDRAAIGGTLFFVLAAAGIAMFLTGRLMRRFGPARLTAFSGLLCGSSAVLVAYAPGITTVYTWAFLVGASSAFIYLPALTAVQAWFTERRGLVSGLVNMVFALSAAIMAPVFSAGLELVGYRVTTIAAGLTALAAGLVAAPFMKMPGELPQPLAAKGGPEARPAAFLSNRQAIRTRSFWFVWLVWVLAGGAGIAMVTLAAPFGLSRGLPLAQAVLLLAAFNLTNGLGRLVSGYLSDFLGRSRMICLSFIMAGTAYLLMPYLQGVAAWSCLAALVGFGFGTQFAVAAPLISECFGSRYFAEIFGLLFTGYGFLAGVAGPWFTGLLLDLYPGNFQIVFVCLACFFFTSAVLILFTRPHLPNSV